MAWLNYYPTFTTDALRLIINFHSRGFISFKCIFEKLRTHSHEWGFHMGLYFINNLSILWINLKIQSLAIYNLIDNIYFRTDSHFFLLNTSPWIFFLFFFQTTYWCQRRWKLPISQWTSFPIRWSMGVNIKNHKYLLVL